MKEKKLINESAVSKFLTDKSRVPENKEFRGIIDYLSVVVMKELVEISGRYRKRLF